MNQYLDYVIIFREVRPCQNENSKIFHQISILTI